MQVRSPLCRGEGIYTTPLEAWLASWTRQNGYHTSLSNYEGGSRLTWTFYTKHIHIRITKLLPFFKILSLYTVTILPSPWQGADDNSIDRRSTNEKRNEHSNRVKVEG
jgi:hypothetical protein